MFKGLRRPSPGTVLGGLALIVATSGVAIAAIPSSEGIVTACLKEGELRVIDSEAGKTCKKKEKTLRLASTDATGKVANADKLDGKNSTDFLGANAKAADSDLLDGIDSTGFLGATAKAADSERLDGKDSSEFVQGTGSVLRHQASVQPGSSTQLVTPYSTISYSCPDPVSGAGTVTYTNTFGGLARTVLDGAGGVAFAAVGVTPLTLNTQASGDHVSIGAVHGLQPLRVVNADVFSGHESGFNICSVYIEAMVS